jgi:hypothetical protein
MIYFKSLLKILIALMDKVYTEGAATINLEELSPKLYRSLWPAENIYLFNKYSHIYSINTHQVYTK